MAGDESRYPKRFVPPGGLPPASLAAPPQWLSRRGAPRCLAGRGDLSSRGGRPRSGSPPPRPGSSRPLRFSALQYPDARKPLWTARKLEQQPCKRTIDRYGYKGIRRSTHGDPVTSTSLLIEMARRGLLGNWSGPRRGVYAPTTVIQTALNANQPTIRVTNNNGFILLSIISASFL